MLCTIYSTPVLFSNSNEHDIYQNYYEKELQKRLINIRQSNVYCFDWIAYYVGNESMFPFVDKQSIAKRNKSFIKQSWTMLNTVSIIISLIIFILFDKPKLIFFISLYFTSSIFISI